MLVNRLVTTCLLFSTFLQVYEEESPDQILEGTVHYTDSILVKKKNSMEWFLIISVRNATEQEYSWMN